MGGKLLLKMTTTLTKACLYDNASSIPRREENEDRDSNNDDEVLLETLISSRSHRLETIVEEDEAPGKDSLQNAAKYHGICCEEHHMLLACHGGLPMVGRSQKLCPRKTWWYIHPP
eukprot:scaffold8050_cov180-Amphora_coffeaeformis.AAC.8